MCIPPINPSPTTATRTGLSAMSCRAHVSECGHNLAIKIFRALDAVPRTVLVFEGEHAVVTVIQHDAHIPLDIGTLPTIPILRVNIGMGVGGEVVEGVEQKILVLPVAEV